MKSIVRFRILSTGKKKSPPYFGAFSNGAPASAAIKNYGSVWALGCELIPQKPYKTKAEKTFKSNLMPLSLPRRGSD